MQRSLFWHEFGAANPCTNNRHMKIIDKPANNEFAANEPMLAQLVPGDGLLLEHLATNLDKTRAFITSLPEEILLYRYAKDKWTIKEMIMHLTDMERVYAYRSLCLARHDLRVLPGFDAERFTLFSGANDRDISGLLDELAATRQASIMLFNGFPDDAFVRIGTVNGTKVSVRALMYHIAGHEMHHVKIIKERYL